MVYIDLIVNVISTHTLTWSVTNGLESGAYNLDNFNSHAHVERDGYLIPVTDSTFISTHTLTWSVTQTVYLRNTKKIFQLTRSRGA